MTRDELTPVFVLGATGMLGQAMFRVLAGDARYAVRGVVRDEANAAMLRAALPGSRIVGGFDAMEPSTLASLLDGCEAPVVVNCVGLIKQLAGGNEVLAATPINTLLPHRLAEFVRARDGRLVHFSTDCVFSGERGGYTEDDVADARDVYGLTKYLGEVAGAGAVTLRTSIVGHGLAPNGSLIDWFLAQEGPVRGFRRAIFSGLPTVELARVVRDHVLPDRALSGLYHVSAEPIDKFTLLQLVRQDYGLDTQIEPYDDFAIDRSLDSSRFRKATGWQPRPWPELVAAMHDDYSGRTVSNA